MAHTGSRRGISARNQQGSPRNPWNLSNVMCATCANVHGQPNLHPIAVVFAFAAARWPTPKQRLSPEYVSVRLLFWIQTI
jgi:hypothetical protein